MSQKLGISSIILLLCIFSHLNVLAQGAPIIFTPNKDELNLPFQIKNGKLDVQWPNPSLWIKPIENRIIASCLLLEESPLISKSIQVVIYKNKYFKTADLITTLNNEPSVKQYPYVHTETVTKQALGQYSVAVDVAHVLGITKVDSLRVYAFDPNPKNFKGLIFFYDEDGEIIDRTILIDNRWQRCEKQ